MTATLQLNLSDVLNADELRELTSESLERKEPLERVLFEGAKEVIRRRREGRKATNKQAA
jgi:hypothetical protein